VSKRARNIRKMIILKINLPTKNSKWQTEDNNILTRLQEQNKNKSISHLLATSNNKPHPYPSVQTTMNERENYTLHVYPRIKCSRQCKINS
jgi:hypothetical protein